MSRRDRTRRKNKRRYLGNDKSIRVLNSSDVPDHLAHGPLVDPKHSKWEYAVPSTMEELFAKGVLNQNQIDSLNERGIDIEDVILARQLEELHLDNEADFKKLAKIARTNPDAIEVMNKIEINRRRAATGAATRQRNKALEATIRRLDTDTEKGMREFSTIAKDNPKAIELLEKIMAERNPQTRKNHADVPPENQI